MPLWPDYDKDRIKVSRSVQPFDRQAVTME